METIKIKSIAIGSLMCLVPIIFGFAFRELMPYGEVFPIFGGKFAERDFIIFGIPFVMSFAHIFFCLLFDIIVVDKSRGKDKKFLIKSIVPVINFIAYLIVVIYILGSDNDVTKITSFVFGSILIALGLYAMNTEKFNFIRMKTTRVRSRQIRKFNIFVGWEMFALGLLFDLNVFLGSVFTAIFVILFFAVLIITIAVAQSMRDKGRR